MSVTLCKSIGCNHSRNPEEDFCPVCLRAQHIKEMYFKAIDALEEPVKQALSMAEQYPKYFKSVGELTEIDVYAVHHLFNIQDPSAAIQHASKKLLLSGVRTGGKSKYQDIKEARNSLNRWLELNPEMVG